MHGTPRTTSPTVLMVILNFVCRGGYYPPAYYNPSVIFLRKCHLPLHKGGIFWFSPCNLVLYFLIVGDDILGVPFIKIIVFCADVQCTPLRVCAIFVILVVGRPLVVRGRSMNALGPSGTPVPTGFGENFNILIVVEHSICSRRRNGGYGIRPYGFF